MRRTTFYILSTTLVIFLISACAGPTRVEKNYGKSYKQALANQILDPEAEKNLEPVTGFDGKASQITVEKYRKGFEPSREGSQPLSVQIGAQGQGAPSTPCQSK